MEEKKGQTCVCCRVLFSRPELHRDHYKTDWHRYNLKRRVATLPPLTASAFQTKVLAHRQIAETKEEEAQDYRCVPCRKSFRSEETFKTHVRSRKHSENAKSSEESEILSRTTSKSEEEVEEEDSDWEDEEGEGIANTECLFCLKPSTSLEDNMAHMYSSHGFFIPDAQYCTDLPGLITYLGEKVGIGMRCLWCNERGKSFQTMEAAQKHMRDKSHCKIAHESVDMLEFDDYFDFSSSYPEGEDDDEGEVHLPALEERGWELVLPSGGTVGHRTLHKYFKQNLKPNTAVALRKGAGNPAVMKNVLSKYKALGWTGATGEASIRKAKDLAFMNRLRQKKMMQLGMQGNMTKQMHFRSAC